MVKGQGTSVKQQYDQSKEEGNVKQRFVHLGGWFHRRTYGILADRSWLCVVLENLKIEFRMRLVTGYVLPQITYSMMLCQKGHILSL
jgi:hypothetical protein